MTQSTETDIRELKDIILGIDKKIDDVKAEIRGLDKKIDIIDTRLIEVEKKIDKQDTRLWTFSGIVLSAALGTIIKLLAFPNPSLIA
jgi:chromosome segregation ATPase